MPNCCGHCCNVRHRNQGRKRVPGHLQTIALALEGYCTCRLLLGLSGYCSCKLLHLQTIALALAAYCTCRLLLGFAGYRICRLLLGQGLPKIPTSNPHAQLRLGTDTAFGQIVAGFIPEQKSPGIDAYTHRGLVGAQMHCHLSAVDSV